MIKREKCFNRVGLLAVFAVLVITTAVFAFFNRPSPRAETAAVALTPICSSSDIAYSYLDSPTGIFADASGVIIPCRNDLQEFAGADFSVPSRTYPLEADKVLRDGTLFVFIKDGAAYYSDDGSTATPIETNDAKIKDIALSADKLYLVASNCSIYVIPVVDRAPDTSAQTVYTVTNDGKTVEPNAVTVIDNTVYFAVKSSILNYKTDICFAGLDTAVGNNLEVETVAAQTDDVIAMTSVKFETATYVYALTDYELCSYIFDDNGLTDRHTLDNFGLKLTDICAVGGAEPCLYALDRLTAVSRITPTLTEVKTLAASASSADGFFFAPSGAAVKHSTLYVADSGNGRIAEYGNEISYVDKKFISPTSVASDSKNTLYVAHDYNKLAVISDGVTSEYTLSGSGAIKRVLVNSDKAAYILAKNGIWLMEQGEKPVKISDKKYLDITLSFGNEDLYAIDGTTAVKLNVIRTEDGVTVTAGKSFAVSDPVSVAADLYGNMIVLTKSGITRIARNGTKTEFALSLDGASYTVENGQILLDSVKNAFLKPPVDDDKEIFTNVVIVDSNRHRVFYADGEALGITLIEVDKPPVVPNDELDCSYDEDPEKWIIRVALDDASVFNIPAETSEKYNIAKGRKVIVPVEQPENTPKDFFFVLIDDLYKRTLVSGFVYKDTLSEPLPYEPPTDAGKFGTVYSSSTPVYKWPSIYSPKLKTFGSLERSTELTILDFVRDENSAAYKDDNANLWYRVKIADAYEGFILAANISLMEFEPVFIRPAYNAEIISYEGSTSAQAYSLEDYSALPIYLPTGTQVEIDGTYDTSEEFTKIKYFNAELGRTVTCYVRTVYLKYNGVNVVLLVAIIVIVITVILAVIILLRVWYVKRQRLTAPSSEKVEDGDEQ